jgi:hypothetical protein
MTNLEIIIQRFQKAFDITTTNHSDRADWFDNLEIEHWYKYQRQKQ